MPRFHRVNLDGKSWAKTETRLCAAALLPGTFAVITDGQFEQATGPTGRLYVINPGYETGKTIMEPVTLGDSAVGNYVEPAREFALRFAGGTTVEKDTPITVGADGYAAVGEEGTDFIVGYSQETETLPAGADDFIRVRMQLIPAA